MSEEQTGLRGSVMTLAQIESQFADEWVLIEDPHTDSELGVESGKVRWHSRDRDEVYRKAIEFRPRRFAVLFAGEMPSGTAIVLLLASP